MNVVNIADVNPAVKIQSVGDTAMYLNLFYNHIVDMLLETYTDFTDFDIIAEIIDELNLDITCVVDAHPQGKIIYGYINNECKVRA